MTEQGDAHRVLRQEVDIAGRNVLWGAVDRLLAEHGPARSPYVAVEVCIPCYVEYPCTMVRLIAEAVAEGE